MLAVLRETLSNNSRHAHATTVKVTAETDGTRLQLRVADNGTGIDPAVTRRSGLDNLRRRATDLGGSFILTPNDPTGTTVERTLRLPTQAEASAPRSGSWGAEEGPAALGTDGWDKRPARRGRRAGRWPRWGRGADLDRAVGVLADQAVVDGKERSGQVGFHL
ncbi:sensor histidine kinase [Streptomyces sp. NPDC005151]